MIDAADYRTLVDASESEQDWQRKILRAARLRGWSCYHTHNSRHSAAGFPDLVCVRREVDGSARLVAIECKTAKGRVRGEQWHWLDLFGALPGATGLLARPADWDRVVEALGGTS